MVQVITSNTGSFLLDDVYVQNVLPQSTIVGANPNILGCVGTASWGPVNVPLLCSSLGDVATKFGLPGAAALTDVHDLSSDLALALGQGFSSSGVAVQSVRASDGTDAFATGSLLTVSTSVSVETATLSGTISAGDTLNVTFTSTSITGSPVTATYTVLSTDTLTTAAAGLAAVINANSALAQAGVFASPAGAVVTISYLSTISIAFGQSVAGSGSHSEVITLGTGSSTSLAIPGIKLAGKFTGILGNQIVPQVTAGSLPNTFTVTINPFPGFNNGKAEVFANIAAPASGTSFWTNVLNAINKGQGVLRGPSNLVVASNALTACVNPAVGTIAMAGGTDGRNVTVAQLLGTPSPQTAAYALSALTPAVSIAWIAGLGASSGDSAIYASLQSLADSQEFLILFTFPLGTSVSQVVTDVQTYGINDYQVAYVYQWLYIFDAYNQQTRLVPPCAVAAGAIGALAPWSNPSNKQVSNILGTERSNGINPSAPFANSDLILLETNGVMPITKPIPQGNVFGFRNGRNSSNNTQANQINYTRTTNFILQSIDGVLGKFEGDEQTNAPDDPLRAAITAAVTSFFAGLPRGAVQSYNVDCSTDNNTQISVANYQLNLNVYAQYTQAALDIVLTYQGGARVNTQSNTLGASNPVLT